MSTPRDENADAAAERAASGAADAAASPERDADQTPGEHPTGVIAPDDELRQTAVLDDVRATEVIDPLPGEQVPAARADRPRRRVKAWIIVLTSIVALVALVVVADLVTRSILEQRISEQSEASLPDGVEGDVVATVGGFSVLGQLATGSLEEITFDAPGLEVDGNPLDVHLVARGVPGQRGATIERVSGTVDVDEASVNHLVEVPGADGEISLGDGTLGYSTSVEVLGLELTASVTASAEAAGTNVLLTPVGVELSAGGKEIDLGGLAQRLLGDGQIDVCVAKYLPEGVLVEDIALTEGHAHVAFTSTDVVYGDDSLQTLGTCDTP